MEITVVRPGAEVTLAGRLDVSSVSDVRLALHEALEAGDGELVVDLAGVELVDATGLGVLVGVHRRAQRTGRVVVLRDPADRIRRVLFVTRLDRVLRTARTVPTAASA
jgi:anti-sigma B factor antagonist